MKKICQNILYCKTALLAETEDMMVMANFIVQEVLGLRMDFVPATGTCSLPDIHGPDSATTQNTRRGRNQLNVNKAERH